ncbi:MAG: outer membrane protein [Candidatus Angelobacter sp.]|jgi:putative membrane protein|nr:outer membrane protein [Candidatus Angelobacter sp.]
MKNIFLLSLIAVLSLSVACNKTRGNEKNATSSESQPAQGTSGSDQSANSQAGGQMSSADHEFVMNAAKGGKAEVELGNLAAQNASNPAVKQFGQRMVSDHTQANNRLQQIAQQKGMSLPDDLPDDAKQLKDRLTQEKGVQFDRTYMQNMVQDHQKDVAEFQQEADQGQDPEIKNFAATTLPVLKQHLQLAQTDLSKLQK